MLSNAGQVNKASVRVVYLKRRGECSEWVSRSLVNRPEERAVSVCLVNSYGVSDCGKNLIKELFVGLKGSNICTGKSANLKIKHSSSLRHRLSLYVFFTAAALRLPVWPTRGDLKDLIQTFPLLPNHGPDPNLKKS